MLEVRSLGSRIGAVDLLLPFKLCLSVSAVAARAKAPSDAITPCAKASIAGWPAQSLDLVRPRGAQLWHP